MHQTLLHSHCFLATKSITMHLKQHQPLFSPSLLLFFFFQCILTLAQSPAQPPAQPPTQPPPLPPALPPAQPLVLAPAQGPAPPAPTNVSKILEKAKRFTTLLRLLKSTQMDNQLNTQLNKSNQGITLFAPSDSAFSSLKAGTLNSLTDHQQAQLIQFHVISTFLSIPQFQTVTNPVRTVAGDSKARFPLNITTYGNSVNMSTGLVNASVSGTIYTDNQLAVYQVDKVLLPIDIFVPKPPAPAPAPTPSKKPKKVTSTADSPDSVPVDTSHVVSLGVHGIILMVPLGLVAIFTAFS